MSAHIGWYSCEQLEGFVGMNKKEVRLGSITIEISNPEKVLYPDNFSKADLVEYYQKIAETMLPHIQGHPINMQRFPNGIADGGFYEKEIPDYFPGWVGRTDVYVKGKDETQSQVVCNDAATLVYIAEQDCITLHAWLSRSDKLDYPDKMVFDLDPPGKNFKLVKFAAQALRDILDQIELKSFLMTTGSRGLHVVIPLDRSSDFDTTRGFARDLVEALAQREPDKLTTEVRKNKRRGRLFLDYMRNSYAHTAVPPYALRAISGQPVAAPLDWVELDRSDLHAQSYTAKNIFQRLSQKGDPWKDFFENAHNLSDHRNLLDQLITRIGK